MLETLRDFYFAAKSVVLIALVIIMLIAAIYLGYLLLKDKFKK